MAENYRLIFKGEVVEGQHPAVVRKRLALALKLDDQRVQALFSGNAVVVRKLADEETARRFQAIFQKAGARLRVMPVADDPAPGTDSEAKEGSWILLPAGSDVLTEAERRPFVPRDVETGHLQLEKAAVFRIDAPEEPLVIDVPDFEVMALGSRIGDARDVEPPEVPQAEFDLAAPGARMGPEAATPTVSPALGEGFDLAEPGARMAPESRAGQVAVPDTKHIRLADDQTD
ncbi:MAG: hypothetical protein R3E84_07525 [Pseudomonadales bacterium]